MEYLQCLPDPRTLSSEDCQAIDAVMERMAEIQGMEIETVPATFEVWQGPQNCRKYRLHNRTGKNTKDLILECCLNDYEKQLMAHCLYSMREETGLVFFDLFSVFGLTETKWEKHLRLERAKKEMKRQERLKAQAERDVEKAA